MASFKPCGLYVPAATAIAPSQRIIEAAALLPDSGAVGGWASAYWRGVRLLDGVSGTARPQPVLLLLGPTSKIRKRPLIELSRDRLADSDVEEFRGVRRSSDLRTAFDGARLATSLYGAVVFLDMMLTAGLVEVSQLATYWAEHPGWRGVGQARHALSLGRYGSRSPPETVLRLVWVLEAGFPPPLVNPAVFDLDGRLLGYPDLLDADAAVALEYDGDDHRNVQQHADDNVREELFEEHGLVVCRVGRLDLRNRRAQTIQRLAGARARGLARDPGRDRWTLQPPTWWPG